MTLREQVGQLILAGVEGAALSATEAAWLKLIRPGGVILFRRNIESAEQSAALLAEATRLSASPLFRCVDVEGGLVDRLRDTLAPIPSAAAVFSTGDPALFRQHGELIAQAIQAGGFNTTFAPVLDLALPESAQVMRTRVVSPDPAAVFAYASAFLDGLESEHVLGCGKHFPGLGGGALDSHLAMPEIPRSWSQMWTSDLVPYRALAARLPLVMVAHAAYPAITGDRTPASISPYWIGKILRRRLKFPGLIVSDDMEMGGILTQCSIEEAAVQAIAAGTDIVEICRDPALILRAYESLLSEAEKSAAFRRKMQTACRRILAFKQQRLGPHPPQAASAPQIAALRERIQSFTASLANGAQP